MKKFVLNAPELRHISDPEIPGEAYRIGRMRNDLKIQERVQSAYAIEIYKQPRTEKMFLNYWMLLGIGVTVMLLSIYHVFK